jgi:hypothetical protein
VKRLMLAGVVILAVTGCAPSSGQRTILTTVDSTVTSRVTSRVTETTPPPVRFRPTPAVTAAPLPPGQAPAKGEIEKPCPYIVSSQDQGPDSLADLEGDRVYRTTVLTGMSPPGCRFYFWAAPYEAIAEIATRRFSDSVAAHDAMVRNGEAGTQVEGKPDIVPGVDAVLYRTRFFGPDGARDWACVFAKGKVMVTVRTQRADTSLNALLIAQAIAPKF